MSDELKERKKLKLIVIVRFVCATFDVGHPIIRANVVRGRGKILVVFPRQEMSRPSPPFSFRSLK
jgi:hypothetical protein